MPQMWCIVETLRSSHYKHLAATLHFNAYGTLPTEQDVTCHTARLDGEIQPVPRQTQVAQRCAVPNAVEVMQG
jgi:hypothetical protein